MICDDCPDVLDLNDDATYYNVEGGWGRCPVCAAAYIAAMEEHDHETEGCTYLSFGLWSCGVTDQH